MTIIRVRDNENTRWKSQAKKTNKKNKKPNKQTNKQRQKRSGAGKKVRVKGWDLNDFVLH